MQTVVNVYKKGSLCCRRLVYMQFTPAIHGMIGGTSAVFRPRDTHPACQTLKKRRKKTTGTARAIAYSQHVLVRGFSDIKSYILAHNIIYSRT